jgi:hypothetical protein
MVIIDEYSRYPVVETLTSLTAKSVIPLLDKTFSYIPFHVIAVLSLLFPDDPDVQGQLHAFVNPWYNDSVIM